jgi:hypothetical protein
LVVADKMLRAMMAIFGADRFSRRGVPPITRDIDELSVLLSTKASNSYCFLSPVAASPPRKPLPTQPATI